LQSGLGLVQVAARLGGLLLRDTVVWDVAQPFNAAEAYASALCEGLGLRYNWFTAIVAHVQQLLTDVRDVRRPVCMFFGQTLLHGWLSVGKHVTLLVSAVTAKTAGGVRRRSGWRAAQLYHSWRQRHAG
jgi:SNF5 / SMARCB1 / INI1